MAATTTHGMNTLREGGFAAANSQTCQPAFSFGGWRFRTRTAVWMCRRPGFFDNEDMKQKTTPKTKRGNPQQIEERVSFVAACLVSGLTKGLIKKAVLDKYGLGYREVERLIKKAKTALLAESGKAREELISEAYGFYRRIIQDSKSSVADRLRARERIDQLFGLDAPKQIISEISGPGGSPLLAGVQVYLPEKQTPVIDAHVQAPPLLPERTVNGEH